jgi:hypothetical protein
VEAGRSWRAASTSTATTLLARIISQEFATLPGRMYRLGFQLAGNPNADPVVKTLTASLGAATQNFSFDTTGHTNLDLGWVEKGVDTLSCSATMRVTTEDDHRPTRAQH